MNQKESESLRTVQRALDILNCFSLEEPELSLTEIANKIHLAKSTTTRLLATLELNHMVYKNPDTLKYRLGHRLYYLGHIARKSIKIREVAKPVMQQLRDLLKETVNLYVLEKDYRVCVEQIEGLMPLRHSVKIGERIPLCDGAASGKAILAYQSDDFKNQIFKTADTNFDLIPFINELKAIQREMISTSHDENEVTCVASPIFDVNGEVKASLSVSGPSSRFTEEKINLLKDYVKDAAHKISSLVGYMGTENK
jgi:DNA-binding IclR family transcriptional regulator